MSASVNEPRTGATPGKAINEVCAVQVADGHYGIAIEHVLEIVGSPRTQAVPLAPPFVGGLVHYRGDVLTAISLRRLLGLPTATGKQDLLILEGAHGNFGLLVDSIREVLTIAEMSLEPNPPTLPARYQGLFAGACKRDTHLLVMLNPAHLEPGWLAQSA